MAKFGTAKKVTTKIEIQKEIPLKYVQTRSACHGRDGYVTCICSRFISAAQPDVSPSSPSSTTANAFSSFKSSAACRAFIALIIRAVVAIASQTLIAVAIAHGVLTEESLQGEVEIRELLEVRVGYVAGSIAFAGPFLFSQQLLDPVHGFLPTHVLLDGQWFTGLVPI